MLILVLPLRMQKSSIVVPNVPPLVPPGIVINVGDSDKNVIGETTNFNKNERTQKNEKDTQIAPTCAEIVSGYWKLKKVCNKSINNK